MQLTFTILLLLSPYLAGSAVSQPPPHPEEPQPNSDPRLVCEPFGTCEQCPETELHQPFCQPFGNRRLLHCRPAGSLNSEHEGDTLAWGACGRIIATERTDFFEFLLCNAAFALVAMLILFARSRRLADLQARNLAARIGLTRPTGN